MINIDKRRSDILKLVKSLDITPSMYMNAVEKYKAVATYLQAHNIECDIYPQGSFALGTVIKPVNKSGYDLDTICRLFTDKSETSAKEVKSTVGDVFAGSERYKNAIEYDKCWTINYADIGNYGFSLDIVPAVDEDYDTKSFLTSKSLLHTELINTSIAITKKTDETYRWSTSNPKGYIEWFNKINEPFKNYDRKNRRLILFEQNRALFSSVEEIPEMLERSSLQIAIQILKRHRDVYFNRRKNGDELRPISAVICTLAASIAENAPKEYSPFELLEFITNELKIYSELSNMEQIRFTQKYSQRNLISRKKGIWTLMNPANPNDNLLDSWNENQDKAPEFFKWLSVVISDFNTITTANDAKFIAAMENAFDYNYVRSSSFFEDYRKSQTNTKSLPINPVKPWGYSYD